ERLSFARLHFCDLPVSKSERTLQLHVKHLQTQNAPRNDSSHGNGLDKIGGFFGETLQCFIAGRGEFAAPAIDPYNLVLGGLGLPKETTKQLAHQLPLLLLRISGSGVAASMSSGTVKPSPLDSHFKPCRAM